MPDPTAPAPFRPAWWLRNRHLQTLFGKFARQAPPVPTRLERWDTPDGDFVQLERLAGRPGAPRLLMLHGLEGTTRSHYVRGMFAECARRGWAADLLFFRSCGGESNRLARFYHSGETGDLAFVVERLVAEEPARPLLLSGVSLGGNVLLKWLGECGDRLPAPLRAAAAVSVPYDLARGSTSLERGFARVYARSFLRSLVAKAATKGERFPDLPGLDRLHLMRTLRDFDDAVTAPLHGFAGADDYYARSSSLRFLHAVRLPTLLVSAVDDPFLPPAVLDEVGDLARANPALTTSFQPHGGHVGFVGGVVPWRPAFWAERTVCDWLAGRLAAGGGQGREEAA